MTTNKNFLLGFGERLVEPMEPPPSMVEKNYPYTFAESKSRLVPEAIETAKIFSKVSALACPQNKTVAVITLHPTFLAKSYYPRSFMDKFELTPIGSKTRSITPKKWTVQKHPSEVNTTEIFVSGTRNQFANLSDKITSLNESSAEAKDMIKIESFRPFSLEDKIKPLHQRGEKILYEIVLHSNPSFQDNYILEGFVKYLSSFNLDINIDERLYAKGLCFLALTAPYDSVKNIAEYSFLRVIREMPQLQPINSVFRATTSFPITFPNTDVLDKGLRVAVFDGGMKTNTPLDRWVNQIDGPNLGSEVPDAVAHGFSVTSALLFGTLKPRVAAERPYAKIDNYRVFDALDLLPNGEQNAHSVLNRIVSILKSTKYEYINFSIGPDIPIEDDDVHAWTAVLDDIFSSGSTFVASAVGNSGIRDWASGNARIQPPSDAVNVLSVGACDTQGPNWQRAFYSSIGPGRSPGIIKPDVLGFGGVRGQEPFYLVDVDNQTISREGQGTSFATPLVLRTALAIRSQFGAVLTPLAVKALLIHTAEYKNLDKREIGWGRIGTDIEDIVKTNDSTVRILYQGTLSPADWAKCPIPMPNGSLVGSIKIKATICFGTSIDPQDPVNYTRAGLEIRFRPHEDKKKEKQKYPQTKPFFQSKILYENSEGIRHDAHIWETTMSASKQFLAQSVKNPTLNIHYNARDAGDISKTAEPIPYALVITVSAKKIPDLYNRIVSRYRNILEVLQPINIQVPINVS